MLGFSLKFPHGKTEHLGGKALAMNASGNMHPGFADVLLKLKYIAILLERHPQVESNLKTLRQKYFSTLRGCQSCVTSID